MDTKLIEAKEDEIHFVDQIIKNLNHLKHLYKTKLLDEKQLFHVEINDLKGYPHFEPQTQDNS